MKAIFGWKSSSEVDHYIKKARQKKLAADAQHLVVPEGPTFEPVVLQWDKSGKK